jgi:hypothetical protein
MKTIASAVFSLVLCSGTALAAQNVANTSQKGSLVIWPLVSIDQGTDTVIELSNDANTRVHVECYYVNERKGRVDFDFNLTGKQTVSWSVGSLDGDQVTPAAFPTGGSWSGGGGYPTPSIYRGELICFATNQDRTAQIAFNHLSGTATITTSYLDSSDTGAFRYNAWSFVARGAGGTPAANNTEQGTPGRLDLTGNGAGTYDACPNYNIANFMPNGASLGGVSTRANYLSVVSCNQDLRQDYDLYLTKLQFTVWNSYENSFTGAYICVDSVNSVFLGYANPDLTNGNNFEYSVLRTPNAQLRVQGVASTQCYGSVRSGLLGVLVSDIDGELVGTTTHGAGATPGFVLWDPAGGVDFLRGK